MPLVRTSARALFLALIPSAIVQAILLLLLLSLSVWVWEQKLFLGLPAPDGIVVLFALQMTICGSLLYAGHLVLRQFGVYSRMAYCAMGGIAAILAYAMAARY